MAKTAALLLSLCWPVAVVAAPSVEASRPWEKYISSPSSRTWPFKSVWAKSVNSSVTSDHDGFSLRIPAGGHVTLDFGVEVGGLLSFITNTNATNRPQLSLAFTESPEFIRSISDDTGAVPTEDYDRAFNVSVPAGQTFYRMPSERFRGGFRFVTVNALQHVIVSNATCHIGFAPTMDDLRDYSGYFYTGDDTLVKTWYAGAYTVQTNIAPQDTGRFLPQVKPGWAYNATLGVAGPILLDGAKRDRAVWPGDLGISGVSAFLSMGQEGLASVRNALETLFYYQNSSTGEFPFAGPDTASFRSGSQSDTYHAWSLIAIYNYAIFSGNASWVDLHWTNITRGVDFVVNVLDSSTGLHNQTHTNDWARQGGGGYNSALNALDYHALSSLSSLALGVPSNASTKTQRKSQVQGWVAAAERLKASYNTLLWDASANLYRDNQTSAGALLHPQDGNALAVLYNLTQTKSQASNISAALLGNWNPIGPVTPELPDTISPFVSGLEVLAHFTANQPARALELVRRTWGYLLASPLMTGSTLAEGITANGSLHYRSQAGYNHDASYTSLSHSWSTAPTQALMYHVVGIAVEGWGKWRFRPQAGDLKSARGGFESPWGSFEAAWTVVADGNRDLTFEAEVTTPEGMVGEMQLPWQCESVSVDGKMCKGRIAGSGKKVIRATGCR